MNNAPDNSVALSPEIGIADRIAAKGPAIALLTFGIVILYCVGFSAMPAAHNATHDTRHASGFPCH